MTCLWDTHRKCAQSVGHTHDFDLIGSSEAQSLLCCLHVLCVSQSSRCCLLQYQASTCGSTCQQPWPSWPPFAGCCNSMSLVSGPASCLAWDCIGARALIVVQYPIPCQGSRTTLVPNQLETQTARERMAGGVTGWDLTLSPRPGRCCVAAYCKRYTSSKQKGLLCHRSQRALDAGIQQ